MPSRFFSLFAFLFLFPLIHPPALSAEAVSAHARELTHAAVVIDTHADTTQRFLDGGFNLCDVTSVEDGHFDLQKAQEGGLTAEFFSIWMGEDYKGHYSRHALKEIDAVYEQAEKCPGAMMAFSTDDILKAHREGKLAMLMGMEGGHMIEDSLALLRDYYRLGIRYMTLTHSFTVDWADSSGDIDKSNVLHHNGLTDFGKQVVLEMNRLGMMVDISHVSDKTFYDTIAVTRAPVIASHSSARALTNHPRNMTDDMLRAVARNGGVVMVNFAAAFVDQQHLDAYNASRGEREAAEAAFQEQYEREHGVDFVPYAQQAPFSKRLAAKVPRPPFESLIRHIDHIAKVAGVDHVGLGSDFDGVPALPKGIDSVADLPKITQALLDLGYSDDDVKKVLGGNLLRVFRKVERVSREMRAEDKQHTAD